MYTVGWNTEISVVFGNLTLRLKLIGWLTYTSVHALVHALVHPLVHPLVHTAVNAWKYTHTDTHKRAQVCM